MRHRFTRVAAATCTIVLVVGACTDITQPPAQRDLRPSFSHGGPSETVCVGVITGTHDNVTVPPGQGCTVSAALVLGNVKALEDSRVGIVGSTIRGNVEGDGPEFIQVFGGTTVDGNIVVTGAGIDPPQSGPTTVALLNVTVTNGDVHVLKTIANAIFMQGVTVSKGSMKLEDNTGGGVQLFNNFVAQNLQVFKNAGDHIVTGNVVGQNLQCFDNVGTFVGGPNVAEQAQGQCF